MNNGWIKIHRKLIDHWLFKEHRPKTKLEAWLIILLECNHSDSKVLINGTLIDCKTGQSVRSIATWSKEFKWTYARVRSFFKLLEKDTIEVGAATLDRKVSDFSKNNNISSMEFLSCIPGSIGGAIIMNSGCYNSDISKILLSIKVIDDEGNEIVLPKEKQIPNDYFKKGDNVRGVIENVELKGNKPQIIMSRTAPEFLEKLFEQEIPEVFDGLITIKKVVRIPGEKAKVAVDSYDDRIDPVGACVGMKGSRIHGIVRELGNENIDVINHTKNEQLFISRALSPAKVVSMEIEEYEEEKNGKKGRVNVFLKPEEVSKAIGKGGVNIRLASELTKYDIDVQREGLEEEDVELTEFRDEIEAWIIQEFKNIGLDTAKSVLDASVEELLKRTDLEEETILDVQRILKEEFEE